MGLGEPYMTLERWQNRSNPNNRKDNDFWNKSITAVFLRNNFVTPRP